MEHEPVDDKAAEWFFRIFFLGGAVVVLLALVSLTAWKLRSAMMNDDAKDACRRRGGDVVPIDFNPWHSEWRCLSESTAPRVTP